MSNNQKVYYLFLLMAMAFGVQAQNSTTSKINWLSFEQVEEAIKSEKTKTPRKIFIDLYTDNCGWCRKMDLSTFQNEFISHFLNENFYPIRFNAQTKKEIVFNKQLFKLDKSGYHELAIALSMGDLGFPTIVFLDEERQIIQPIPGYQTVDELERIMFYFAHDIYKTTSWREFVLQFKPTNSKPKMAPLPENENQVKKKN